MIFLIYFLISLCFMALVAGVKKQPDAFKPDRHIFSYVGASIGIGMVCQLGLMKLLGDYMLQSWPMISFGFFSLFTSYICWTVCFCRTDERSFWTRVVTLILKIGIIFGILLFLYCNLSSGRIGMNMVTDCVYPVYVRKASVIAIGSLFLAVHGGWFFAKHGSLAKMVYHILLGITPAIVYMIVELSWNPAAVRINLLNSVLNILIYILLEIFFVNLITKKSLGLVLLYITAWLLGAVNYFLLQFRGQPFLVSDIFSIKTAASVAGQYTYQIGEGSALALLLEMPVLSLITALADAGLPESVKSRSRLIVGKVIAVGSIALLATWTVMVDFGDSYQIPRDHWNQSYTYKTAGFAPAFISFLQESRISAPEGYSSEYAARVIMDAAGQYDENPDYIQAESRAKPTIIAIMNEAYSDLSALGPLSCTDSYNGYLHSLKDDPGTIEYGYSYVSTRGGGTAKTEFEFLTGDSMVYSQGVVPYAVFDFNGVPSLISELKNQGYHTIAMHPEAAGNYQRNIVYPELGFDEMLFRDAFEGKETTVWNRVSDLGNYQKLIEVYEQQTEPCFIFNITMQNHGGYDSLDQLSEAEIMTVDERYQDYSDLVVYESLIEKSDVALEYLISYFKKVEEPVIIVFFGDHQPTMNTDFEDSLLEEGRAEDDDTISMLEKRYAVPYFIWSNMESTGSISTANQDGYNVTSPNYLSALLLNYAGLDLSDFDKYRLQLRQSIPAINVGGYMDDEGVWHGIDADDGYKELIDQYEIINYNSLFDKKRIAQCYKAG